MEKDVRGWCLVRDAQGTPTLDECWLVPGGAGGKFFMQGQDKVGNWITLRSYQLGETFFESRGAALRELLKELNRQYVRHAGVVDKLDRQIRSVVDELEEVGNAER